MSWMITNENAVWLQIIQWCLLSRKVIFNSGLILFLNDWWPHAYWQTSRTSPVCVGHADALKVLNLLVATRGRWWDGVNDDSIIGHTAVVDTPCKHQRRLVKILTTFCRVSLLVCFLEWKLLFFHSNFTEICSHGSTYQQANFRSDNGLVPSRWQAITWSIQCWHKSTMSLGITKPQSQWVNEKIPSDIWFADLLFCYNWENSEVFVADLWLINT